jgi:peptide chain release factor subunit 3
VFRSEYIYVIASIKDGKFIKTYDCRYNEIKEKLTPYLKKCGFNPKTDIYYLPVSGYTGVNLKERNPEVCPWYE